jgi:hypothetical protein
MLLNEKKKLQKFQTITGNNKFRYYSSTYNSWHDELPY